MGAECGDFAERRGAGGMPQVGTGLIIVARMSACDIRGGHRGVSDPGLRKRNPGYRCRNGQITYCRSGG